LSQHFHSDGSNGWIIIQSHQFARCNVGSVGVNATGQILDSTFQDWSTVLFGLSAAINIVGAVAFITPYDSKKRV
jgi:hypothetical protein